MSPYSLSAPGGVQGQVLGLARALRADGIDARVVGPCDGPPPEPGITTVGPTTGVATNGSIAPIASSRAVARRTLEALRYIAPDVVHLHEPLVPGPALTCLLESRAPLVGTFHAAGRQPWYSALRPALRGCINRLQVRTVVSVEALLRVQEAFPGDYLVLPNGVDVERFATAEPWPAPTPAVLFVGRHEERKGLGVLLDAFEGLDRRAELWVVGDGPETQALAARDVAGVQWLGRVSDAELASRLAGATTFCAPSLHGESFGVVLLEAMAAGAAVVASSIPGYADVARADREALLVAPGDAAALRDALRRTLDDVDLRNRLVAVGRERAAELSMAALAGRYAPVYASIVGATTGSSRRAKR